MACKRGYMAYQQWLSRKVEEFERAPDRFGIDRGAFFMGMDLLTALTLPGKELHVTVKEPSKKRSKKA